MSKIFKKIFLIIAAIPIVAVCAIIHYVMYPIIYLLVTLISYMIDINLF